MIPLYGSRNTFLFLIGTRVPTRRKSRNIKNVPLGFRRNPNRNRNPAPGSCPPKIGTKIGMCSLGRMLPCCPLPLLCHPSPSSCRLIVSPVALVLPRCCAARRRAAACRRRRAACRRAAPCRCCAARCRRRAALSCCPSPLFCHVVVPLVAVVVPPVALLPIAVVVPPLAVLPRAVVVPPVVMPPVTVFVPHVAVVVPCHRTACRRHYAARRPADPYRRCVAHRRHSAACRRSAPCRRCAASVVVPRHRVTCHLVSPAELVMCTYSKKY